MSIETRIEDLKAELARAEAELRALEEMALARFMPHKPSGAYEATLNMAVKCELVYRHDWSFQFWAVPSAGTLHKVGGFASPGAAALAAVRYARDVLTQTSVFLAPLTLPLKPLEMPG